MLVRIPASVRVLIALLIVLAQVTLQTGKALPLVLCTEQDGRGVVEFGAAGYCQHPASVVEHAVAAVAEPCCVGCTDRVLAAEPSTMVGGKRGEAPRTILPTGPPSPGVIGPLFLAYPAPEATGSVDHRICISDIRDPSLVALRTNRLLI